MKQQLRACITLDLESDHAGLAPKAYAAWEKERVDKLLRVLSLHKVKLTAFVVAEVLEIKPQVIESFLKYGTEFQLHSLSHDLDRADSPREILKGKKLFKRFFGYYPEGYRAPEGGISAEGLRLLGKEGFLFDASIYPSFWPNPKYFLAPNKPYRPLQNGVLEIPFSTLSPIRLILSLSWIKLYGWRPYRFWLENFSLPDILVFGMHLHDLWTVPVAKQLTPLWKFVYSRSQNQGLVILDEFFSLIKARGYGFSTVGTVAKEEILKGGTC